MHPYFRKQGIALAAACCFLLGFGSLLRGGPSAPEMNPEYAQILTNAPPPGFATRLDYVRSFNNRRDVWNAYRSKLLNEGETMIAMEALEDRASMDIYGKLIDQDGQPVSDADVCGSLDVSGDFIPHLTKTDEEGRFHFIGLTAQNYLFQSGKKDMNLIGDWANAQRITWQIQAIQKFLKCGNHVALSR